MRRRRGGVAARTGLPCIAIAAALITVPLTGCAGAHGQGETARSQALSRQAGDGDGSLRRVSFYSPARGQADHYLAYLPPGYAAAARRGVRFPVLYLLHGDGKDTLHTASHMFVKSGLGPAVSRLLGDRRIQPFIVVMPEGEDGTLIDDTEWADTRGDGAFGSEVIDLVKAVDARWATVADRGARAIAGLSMGGYGAVNIALQNLPLFSVIESWSGYFTQTRTGPYVGASAATLRAASPQAYVRGLAPSLSSFPIHVLLYGGIGDALLRQQAPFARTLGSLGVPVRTASFHGPHDYRLWSAHMALALEFASKHLNAGR
ncbi:MAG TPA: alpha/beta hydrolase-fold protein [Solirubrobacterales bacterium]|nr:alpha/beta hydrolase-fold protein [Solirubrobacterales bacterium]